jgi:hypothetical protein
VIAQPVLGLQPDDHGYQLLGDGSTLHAAQAVLATGNSMRRCRWPVPRHCPPMT